MNLNNFIQTYSPAILSLLRIITGLIFIQHATAKLFAFPHLAEFDNLKLLSFFGMVGLFELIGGAFIVLGLFTRPIAFLLSGQMAVAYFMVHAPKSFFPMLNDGEPAIFFCFIFLYLAFAGAGSISIDEKI